MFRKRLRYLVFFATLPLLLLATAGLSFAHDTGLPHTLDAASVSNVPGVDMNRLSTFMSESMPSSFLVIPISGELFPFHWLWHFMRVTVHDDHDHFTHELMHWHGIPHLHGSGSPDDACSQSAPLAQFD